MSLWSMSLSKGPGKAQPLVEGRYNLKKFFIKKYSWLTHFGTANPNKYRIFVETSNQSVEMMTQGLQMESS